MARTYCFSCGADMDEVPGQEIPVCDACQDEHGDDGELGTTSYRIKRGGRSEGPLTYEQIREQIVKGLLRGEDRITAGRDWTRVDQDPEFSGYFIPGDPRFEEVQEDRERTKGKRASRERRESARTFMKVGVVLAVIAVPVALYATGVQLISDDTVDAVSEDGGEVVDNWILQIQKAFDPSVAQDELEKQRGYPGEAVIQEIKADWPDAKGGVEERISLGKLGLLQGTRAGWSTAQREFEYAVAVDSENVEALAGLAVVYARLREEDERYNNRSLELYARASTIDAGHPAVLRAQAGMSIMSGAWTDAETRSKSCLDAVQDDGVCLWYLGKALTELGRYAEAEKALSKSKEMMGDAPVVDLSLGWSALETFQYHKAFAPLEAFASRYPEDPDIHALLARYHREIGEYDEAIGAGRTSIRLDTEGAYTARLLVGELLLHEKGDAASAYEVLAPATAKDVAIAREDRVAILLPASIAARLSDHPEDSLTWARELADLDAGWPPGQLALALAYQVNGDDSAAEDALKLADITSVEGRDLARYHVEAARFFTSMGRSRPAHYELEAARNADPEWPVASYELARSFLNLENPRSAVETVTATWTMDLQLDNNYGPVELIPIQPFDLLAFDRTLTRAISQGDALAANLPLARGALMTQHCVATGAGCDKAITLVGDALRRDESNTAALTYMAWLSAQRGRNSDALEHLDRALNNDSVQPVLLSLRGLVYATLQSPVDAERDFKNAHKHGVGLHGIHYRNATALVTLDKRDEAVAMAMEAVKSDKRDVASRALLLALQEGDE